MSNILAIASLVASDALAGPLERQLAEYLIGLFGADAIPSDMPEPEVYSGAVILTREMVGQWTPTEAIALARSLVVGAEKSRQHA